MDDSTRFLDGLIFIIVVANLIFLIKLEINSLNAENRKNFFGHCKLQILRI